METQQPPADALAERAFLLEFMRGLGANNHKAWMDEHRADYQRARAAYTALVQEALAGLQAFEPELRGLRPTDVMFRINKNDRSQRDPEPYKRQMGARLAAGGRHARWAGYYLAVGPDGRTWVGAGKRQPVPADLARIRQEIHYSSAEFQRIREAPVLAQHFPDGLQGEQLQRPPRGYEASDPDIGWLKKKEFVVARHFPDEAVLHPDFTARVLESWRAAQPLVGFLNGALTQTN